MQLQLTLLVVGLGGYFIYDKVLKYDKPIEPTTETNTNNDQFKVKDYVIIEQQSKTGMLSQEAQNHYSKFDFSKITFKNLDESLVRDFNEQQNKEITNIKMIIV